MNIPALLEFLFQGKKRKDGSPFTSHFYAVRDILREEGISDENILNAALLHDVLEDTSITKEYLQFHFGKDVAEIIDLMSKWDSWKTVHCKMKGNIDEMENIWRRYPESTLIKMADRLHNLMTIDGFKKEKQREYIQETKEILLPLFQLSIRKTGFEEIKKPMRGILHRMEQEVQVIEKSLSSL